MKTLNIFVGKDSFDIKTSTFPAGEPFVKLNLEELPNDLHEGMKLDIKITAQISSPEEIFQLLLTKNALEKCYPNSEYTLYLPYVPFGRQDRYMSQGEPFSLKVFANLINDMNFKKVITETPHSDVTCALINNLEVKEDYSTLKTFMSVNFPRPWSNICILAPDAGAMKRAYNVAKILEIENVLCATKFRNPLTGEVTHIHIPELVRPFHYLVIDDICDGGATFIELAKHLKNVLSLSLYVTHGIFSKGRDILHSAGYNNVISRFSFLEKKTNV